MPQMRAVLAGMVAHHAGIPRRGFKPANILSAHAGRTPHQCLVHLKSDQGVSVVAAVSPVDPDPFAAGAPVDLIDEPADAREGFTGLGGIHDEHGLQRICRKQMSAPEEPHIGRQRVDRSRAAAVMPKPAQCRTKRKDRRGRHGGRAGGVRELQGDSQRGVPPACAVRATAQRGQRRTADLVPDWLGSQHP